MSGCEDRREREAQTGTGVRSAAQPIAVNGYLAGADFGEQGWAVSECQVFHHLQFTASPPVYPSPAASSPDLLYPIVRFLDPIVQHCSFNHSLFQLYAPTLI